MLELGLCRNKMPIEQVGHWHTQHLGICSPFVDSHVDAQKFMEILDSQAANWSQHPDNSSICLLHFPQCASAENLHFDRDISQKEADPRNQ